MTAAVTVRRSKARRQSPHGALRPSDGGSLLRRAVAAEAVRMFSTRGWQILLGIAIALPALGTAAAALTIDHKGGPDTSTAEGVQKVLSSGFTAGLLATVLGVLSVTSEYRHGTVGASLLASGSRTRWALSKLMVACPLGLLFTALGQATVLGVGMPILANKGVHPEIWSGDLLRVTLGTSTLGFFAAAWGVGLGLCVRNQLGAVTGVVLYSTLAEAAFLEFAPAVGRFLPGGAEAAIVVDSSLEHLPMAAGYLVFGGWAALSFLIGGRLLASRDLA